MIQFELIVVVRVARFIARQEYLNNTFFKSEKKRKVAVTENMEYAGYKKLEKSENTKILKDETVR